MTSMTTTAAPVAVVTCGAIAADVATVADRRGWRVDVHPLPPLLHNHPERIADAVDASLDELEGRYQQLAVAYADCGTYGALDAVCHRRGLARLGGSHCYDVYAGVERMQAILNEQPGTYVLTDFLAASFHRSVIVELGLDRYPQLRDDYFSNYHRVVWLTQRRTPLLEHSAIAAAASIGLPLEVVDVGLDGLERELAQLVGVEWPSRPHVTDVNEGNR
jgi:hypothetical protein